MTIETFTGECKHYTAKGAKDAKENQNLKPTTLRRTSGQATALRHGEKPEKTSCTAEARRRGDAEKNLISMKNLRKKRGNLGLVIQGESNRNQTHHPSPDLRARYGTESRR